MKKYFVVFLYCTVTLNAMNNNPKNTEKEYRKSPPTSLVLTAEAEEAIFKESFEAAFTIATKMRVEHAKHIGYSQENCFFCKNNNPKR